jgi:hypothetical protein
MGYYTWIILMMLDASILLQKVGSRWPEARINEIMRLSTPGYRLLTK